MSRLRLVALVLLAVVSQTAVFSRFRVFGVAPDVMVLVAVCAGILGGSERGALVGFVAGIAMDLFLQTTPIGLSALVFSVTGYASGVVGGATVRAAWWIPVGTAAVGCLAGEILFACAAAVVGQPVLFDRHLITVVGMVGVLDGMLAIPMLRAINWAARGGGATGPALR